VTSTGLSAGATSHRKKYRSRKGSLGLRRLEKHERALLVGDDHV